MTLKITKKKHYGGIIKQNVKSTSKVSVAPEKPKLIASNFQEFEGALHSRFSISLSFQKNYVCIEGLQVKLCC